MADEFTIERIYIPSCDQSNAINAAADRTMTRKDMAGFYADCLRADAVGVRLGLGRVDFAAVNKAILARWPKGLTFIKERAWKELTAATVQHDDAPAVPSGSTEEDAGA